MLVSFDLAEYLDNYFCRFYDNGVKLFINTIASH